MLLYDEEQEEEEEEEKEEEENTPTLSRRNYLHLFFLLDGWPRSFLGRLSTNRLDRENEKKK
jgi:hypothetical protein